MNKSQIQILNSHQWHGRADPWLTPFTFHLQPHPTSLLFSFTSVYSQDHGQQGQSQPPTHSPRISLQKTEMRKRQHKSQNYTWAHLGLGYWSPGRAIWKAKCVGSSWKCPGSLQTLALIWRSADTMRFSDAEPCAVSKSVQSNVSATSNMWLFKFKLIKTESN